MRQSGSSEKERGKKEEEEEKQQQPPLQFPGAEPGSREPIHAGVRTHHASKNWVVRQGTNGTTCVTPRAGGVLDTQQAFAVLTKDQFYHSSISNLGVSLLLGQQKYLRVDLLPHEAQKRKGSGTE